MRRRRLALAGAALVCAGVIAGLATTARSYVTDTFGGKPVRWPNATATIHHDAATITGAYVTELQAALAVWSNVSGSSFRFIHGGASQAADVTDSNNGSTDIYFSSTLAPYGYAVTMVSEPYTSADITERDVAFNSNISWKTSGTGSGTDFRTVAIHELGHVLGLRHETSKPSVMNVSGIDPSNPRHSLETDDMEALRYLYPATDPGPGPGPGPGPQPGYARCDLTVNSVSVEPEDAEPGDRVAISYRVWNMGTDATAGFTVRACLTGLLVPTPTDPLLAEDEDSGLDAGAERDGVIEADIPTDLPPGEYRYGVLADSEGVVVERMESNNGKVTVPLLHVDRPAIEVGPGQVVTGRLGPRGEDRVRVRMTAGSVLKLRAQTDAGALFLKVARPDSPIDLFSSGQARSPKGRLKILEDGEYEIVYRSSTMNFSEVELTVKAKLRKVRGREAVGGELRVPFRIYRGCTVKAQVKGRKGFVPVALIEGENVESTTKRSRVKLGPWVAPENGERTLVMRSADPESDPGEVKYVIRYRLPEEAIPVTR